MKDLSNIAVVMVGPRGSLNIGSAARAMSNSGLHDLRLVNAARHLNQAARQMAMAGTPILEQARVFEDLDAAVADRYLVVGTSRRRGKARGPFLGPAEAMQRILSLPEGHGAAILFGSEDVGLGTEDLVKCHFCLELPAVEASPSYNLAHSVLLVSHYLMRAANEGADAADRSPAETARPEPIAPHGELEGLYGHMLETLRRIRFFRVGKSEERMRDLRNIFERARIDSREVRIFRGMMKQINYCLDLLERGEPLPEVEDEDP